MGNTALELLELLLDLFALGLFLVELCLEFRCHLVVAILGFFQVEPDLMHVGKGVQVFVLVHLLSVSLGMTVAMVRLLVKGVRVHQHDLALEFFIVSL